MVSINLAHHLQNPARSGMTATDNNYSAVGHYMQHNGKLCSPSIFDLKLWLNV